MSGRDTSGGAMRLRPSAAGAGIVCAVLVALAILIATTPVRAVGPDEGWNLSGEIELGGRTVSGDDWHSSKYEEYRELRPGIFGSGSFLLENQEQPWYLRGQGDDVGERDESYRLELGRWGHYRLGFDYAELPHVFSNQVSSFLDDPGPDDVLLRSPLHSESLDFTLRQAGADLHVRPMTELEFDADYRLLEREGSRPWALGFGSPGGRFDNFAAPIDERIHEVNGGARWATETWSIEGGYTGSFFENRYDRVRAQRFDTTSADLVGQISLAPDNAAHTFRLTGATDLPLDFPSRLSASLAYGLRKQDEDFLCHTINPANPAIMGGGAPSDSCPFVTENPIAGTFHLPENSLDGDVRTFLANLVWTARPLQRLNLTARYRLYDYDNESDRLLFPDYVRSDVDNRSTQAFAHFSVPTEHRRHNASLDVALRAHEAVTLHAEPFWEQWERSDDREATRLYEWGGRFAVDARPRPWTQIRAGYEFGVRRHDDYDPFAVVDDLWVYPSVAFPAGPSDDFFPLLRNLDLADRKRQQVDLLGQVTPREDLSFTLTARYGEADYDGTSYGLTEQTSWSLGGETSWQPLEWLGLSTWYTYEEIRYEQQSRQRPPTALDDFSQDWDSFSEDQIHNLGLRLDATVIPDRLDASVGYEIQHARGKNRSDGFAAENYPGLRDVLQTLHATLDFHAREDLTLRLGYQIERFDLTDFRIDDLDPIEPVSPNDLFLNSQIDDYTAHIVALSAIWSF
jgi:hypothetical protein